MQKILFLSALVSGLLLAETPKTYIDMSSVLFNYSNNGTTTDFKPTGFKWMAGYVVHDFTYASVAVEGSAMLGVNNDTKAHVQNSNGDTFTHAQMALDTLYNLQLKTMVPLTQSFNANLYVGGTRGKTSSSSDQSNNKGSYDNSVSYGAGLEYWSSADVSVYANYMQYFKNLNAVEIGVGFRF